MAKFIVKSGNDTYCSTTSRRDGCIVSISNPKKRYSFHISNSRYVVAVNVDYYKKIEGHLTLSLLDGGTLIDTSVDPLWTTIDEEEAVKADTKEIGIKVEEKQLLASAIIKKRGFFAFLRDYFTLR